MLGTGLGDLRFGVGRHLVIVAVQPALGRLQHRDIAFFGLQGLDFGLAGTAHFARITSHDLVAVRDQGLEGFLVSHRPDSAQLQLGRHFFDRGQTDFFQATDIDPANVEFVRLDRKFGRRGVGVMVVVQLFAANHDAPG